MSRTLRKSSEELEPASEQVEESTPAATETTNVDTENTEQTTQENPDEGAAQDEMKFAVANLLNTPESTPALPKAEVTTSDLKNDADHFRVTVAPKKKMPDISVSLLLRLRWKRYI